MTVNNIFLYINWNPNEVIFSIGSWGMRWYSLCWLIGLACAYFMVKRLYKDQGISKNLFDPLFVYAFLGILIGARLGHCLFYEPSYYLSNWQHMVEMFLPIKYSDFQGWHFTGYEGLASHGGTIGLVIALILYGRKTKISLWKVFDNIAIATPITAFFIRLGNLFNSEIIGNVTNVPWAFIFEKVDNQPRHPGQLYEAICYFAFFFIMLKFYRKKKQKAGSGFFFGLCLSLIFTARFVIEFFKIDQVAFEESLPINMGQILSIPFILTGLYCIYKSIEKKTSNH